MNDQIWHAQYPEWVPKELPPSPFNSIPDIFDRSFKEYGDLPAFENMDVKLTYSDIDRLSANFAAYLQNVAKLKPGDRIAIQMPNCLQFPVVMFGALRAGLICVNTNPLYTAKEMEHQFKDSGAKAIVILENFASNLEKIIKNTAIETVVVAKLGDMLGAIKGTIVNFVVKSVRKMVPAYNLPGSASFKAAMKEGANYNFKPVALKEDDIAFLQYTGGTTGLSKGASLTHRNVISNMEMISEWANNIFKEREELIITALPLYHIFALTVNCLSIFAIGGHSILITNPRDFPGFVKELKKHKFTAFTGVNTLFNALLNEPGFKEIDFSPLKMTLGGGMAVQDVIAEKWQETTGTPLLEAYGLSETSPGLTANPTNGKHRIGTIGLPLPSTIIKLLDDDGNEVPNGEPGEIAAKGPQVMPGYWEKPEENAKVFKGEFFCTGDIGIMDKDGFIKIVDRKKDMILVSGFNVYPNEVENVIAAHDKVLEVGCVGVPDDKSGEAVKVFVVKKDPSLTEEELRAYCTENLAGYKKPKHIAFREELPKSNVGKILRRMLK